MALLDRFCDPRIGCCWDFGHGKLATGSDERHAEAIRALGNRIVCTHVHDNYYKKDLHLPPFMGDADWNLLMRAVKDIGYGGNLTFEIGYSNLDNRLVSNFMQTLRRTGEILLEMMEQ